MSVQPVSQSPSWSVWREAFAVVRHPAHLKSTVTVALLIGSVLFCINQLDVVLRGDATATVWIKSAITYIVPLAVSNAGLLIGSRRVEPMVPEESRRG